MINAAYHVRFRSSPTLIERSLLRSISSSAFVCGNQKAKTSKKGSNDSKGDENDDNKEEIKITIPSLAREEIFIPPVVYKLDFFSADIVNPKNCGNVYQMSSDFLSKISDVYGLPRSIDREIRFFRGANFMLRNSTVDVIEEVVRQQQSQSPRSIFVDGLSSSGKTCDILQTINYFQQKKWLIVHMPTWHWLLGGFHAFELNTQSGLHDQPEAAQNFLRYFKSQNDSILDTVKLSKSYEFGDVKLNNLSTLRELIDCGKDGDSSSVFRAVVDEIVMQSSCPTLLVVDMENGLYTDTLYRDKESNVLKPEDFTISAAFMELIDGSRGLKNGVVLTSTSTHLLGDRGVGSSLERSREKAVARQAILKEIKHFDFKETGAVVNYHMRAGLVPREVVSEQYVRKAYLLSGGNGRQLFDLARERPFLY